MPLIQLKNLLHPDVRAHLPHRNTISKDVQRLYRATQADIIELLAVRLVIPQSMAC